MRFSNFRAFQTSSGSTRNSEILNTCTVYCSLNIDIICCLVYCKMWTGVQGTCSRHFLSTIHSLCRSPLNKFKKKEKRPPTHLLPEKMTITIFLCGPRSTHRVEFAQPYHTNTSVKIYCHINNKTDGLLDACISR
jgi:hypothetical protein